MMYANCPGGDPRPTSDTLPKNVKVAGIQRDNRGTTQNLQSDSVLSYVAYFVLQVYMCEFVK